MINIEEILKEKGISKVRFAEMLGIKPQNVSRTLKRLHENQSEIDDVLLMIGIEVWNATKGSVQTGDINNSTIVGGNVNGNGNNITHYGAEYDACRKEVEHLKELLAEKEKHIAVIERQLADKDTIIELLSKK